MGSHSIDRIDGLATAPAVIRNPPDDTNETDRTTGPDSIGSVVGRTPEPVDPTGRRLGDEFPKDANEAGVDRRSRRETSR